MSRSPDTSLATGLDDATLAAIAAEVAAGSSPLLSPARSPFGEQPTRWRGQGMEAIETRPYRPGDDLRHVDWRASARAGRALSKVFGDERRRSLCLVVDHRATMRYATRGEAKCHRASRCAALLAFAALGRREAVSGILLQDEGAGFFPPTREMAAIIPLLKGEIEAGIALDAHSVTDVLARLDRLSDPSSILIVMSDLYEYNDNLDELESGLSSTADRRTMAMFWIQDPSELELPANGRIRFLSPMGTIRIIDTDDTVLRDRFRSQRQRFRADLFSACHRHGIVARCLRCDEAIPLEYLQALL